MRDYLLKLFAHEHWANAQLITKLKTVPAVPPRTMQLVGHILTAHEFWDKRVRGQEIAQFDFWPPLTLKQCAALNDEYAQTWAEYICSLAELLEEQTVSFTAMDGTPRVLRVVDILTQLHSHSIHHRAQIMLDMKTAGLEPVTTDYLLFCRIVEHDRVH